MPIEKSVGIVLFRIENGKRYYLILEYGLGHWGFPKGHIEKGETLEETARRELEEETGIKKITIIDSFKEWIKYFFKLKGKNIFKIATYFLAETKAKKIKLSFEHNSYKWLSYEKALEQLTFQNTKNILRKADKFLGVK